MTVNSVMIKLIIATIYQRRHIPLQTSLSTNLTQTHYVLISFENLVMINDVIDSMPHTV